MHFSNHSIILGTSVNVEKIILLYRISASQRIARIYCISVQFIHSTPCKHIFDSVMPGSLHAICGSGNNNSIRRCWRPDGAEETPERSDAPQIVIMHAVVISLTLASPDKRKHLWVSSYPVTTSIIPTWRFPWSRRVTYDLRMSYSSRSPVYDLIIR